MSKPNCILPVKRTGNQKNPKLIILLSNPGGNPDWPKRLPEYARDADGEYHDADMDLSVCRDYNEWFDDIITIAARYGIKPSQILLLEYYPYHTVRSADFIQNPNKWNSYARDALTENVAILRTHIVHDVPIFGYYYGCWLGVVPELKKYPFFYKSTGRWKKQKIFQLDNFLYNLHNNNKNF